MSENRETDVTHERNWKTGDTAVAWLCGKMYAKVKVVKDLKDNRGSLHGDIDNCFLVALKQLDSDDDDEYEYEADENDQCSDSENETDMSLFISTLILNAKVERKPNSRGRYYTPPSQFWVPLSAMRPVERCRMDVFRMLPDKVSFYTKPPGRTRFKEIGLWMDPLLPFNVKSDYCKRPKFNHTLDRARRSISSEHEEDFRDFVLQGKHTLHDSYEQTLMTDHSIINSLDTLDYFLQLDVIEERFDFLVTDVMSEREIEDYLQQCWRYNNARANDGGEARSAQAPAPALACAACGRGGAELRVCPRCPAAYHVACRRQWLIRLVQGKNPPRKMPYKEALLRSRLQPLQARAGAGAGAEAGACSSVLVARELRLVVPCPACMWGADPSERVWHMKVFPFTYWRLLLEDDGAPAMKHSKWL